MTVKNRIFRWHSMVAASLTLLFMILMINIQPSFLGQGDVDASLKEQTISLLPVTDDLEFSIVFINYNPNAIDTNAIANYLPATLSLNKGFGSLTYSLSYSFFFANTSYTQDFLDFIATIANTEAITSSLNMTSLQAQAIDGHPRDLFVSRNGTGIPAELVEEWFQSHPYHPQADYQYYVLNLSYFDTTDHSREHWFTVKEVDPDSGVQRHWWRNEWDFPLNFDAKFPYAGYSSKYRDYFFDPFAFQWYTQWDLTWRKYDPSGRPYYQKDLDQYLRDGGNINHYLGTWLADLIQVHPYVWKPSFGNSIAIQLVIFQNVTNLGFTNEMFEWTMNITHFQSVMKELIPHATIAINVTIKQFSDVPELNTFFANSEVTYSGEPPIPNYQYYSGMTLWNYLWDPSFKNKIFSVVSADVVVNGYAFILDNASFAEPGMWAGGGLYTGLGVGGQMIQLMELDRLYYPNRTTPRQGFSRVVIHETGHAIGFPHTFENGLTSPDFIGDVMGYYPGVIRYSKIRMEAFQRQAVNIFIADTMNPLLNQVNSLNPPLNSSILAEIERQLDNITILRETHQYIEAWNELHDLSQYIRQYLGMNPTTSTSTSRSSSTTTTEIPNTSITTTINESETAIPSQITGNQEFLLIVPITFGLLLWYRKLQRDYKD